MFSRKSKATAEKATRSDQRRYIPRIVGEIGFLLSTRGLTSVRRYDWDILRRNPVTDSPPNI
jgi:hypothetical protein